MSAADVLWQQVADASDELAHLIAGIPAGDYGYQPAKETHAELREAAALLDQAISLLQRALDREEPLYSQHMDLVEAANASAGRPLN
jgi:hypothetical protein